MSTQVLGWYDSILLQLPQRRAREQAPFEEICSYAASLFDKVEIIKSDNIQLQVANEQLQQRLLNIQQTLLAGGSNAAKTILSGSDTLATANNNEGLTRKLEEKDKEISKLRESLEANKIALADLSKLNETLTDEYNALRLAYKSLENRHQTLQQNFDAISKQLIAMKMIEAERINLENERVDSLQRERLKKEIQAQVADFNQPSTAALVDQFDTLDDEDLNDLNPILPSRIPTQSELVFDAHEGEVCAVYWGDFLATGGSDRKVKLWKVTNETSNLVATLCGSNASITSLDFEMDAVLASSNDMATRIWSVTDYKSRRTLTGHSAKVWSAKFLGTPTKVASGSQDRTIKVWDINQGASYKTYFAGSSCFDLVYNNYQIISGHFDGKIRCWDTNRPNESECCLQIALQSKVTSLDVSRDGMKLLCSLRDNTIKCLDLRKLEVLETYSDEHFKIGSDCCRAKFSPDGQLITCGASDGSLFIWDTNTAKVEKVLTQQGGPAIAACWSPDGKRMVSVGKRVTVWS